MSWIRKVKLPSYERGFQGHDVAVSVVGPIVDRLDAESNSRLPAPQSSCTQAHESHEAIRIRRLIHILSSPAKVCPESALLVSNSLTCCLAECRIQQLQASNRSSPGCGRRGTAFRSLQQLMRFACNKTSFSAWRLKRNMNYLAQELLPCFL